ncbi:MAG: transglycosylase domain-containing protein [Bacteroidales bacterium]|nr:transglycosylase domain-containing protein [Bacteroidales bacterium]
MGNISRSIFKALLTFVIVFFILFLLLWNGFLLQVPSYEDIKSFKLPEASEVYSSDSVLLGKIYTENRTCISFEEIPDSLINCLIATEDSRFYWHNGVDIIGLIRIGFKTGLFDSKSGGGSTITQQLVKNRYPRKNFNTKWLLFHKIREWVTAMKFERLYSKEEILVQYLNTVPFGHNCFGIHTAAQYYFDKTPKALHVHEMATLIGLLKGTSYYDPERYPDRCIMRRNLVLSNMNKEGYLSSSQLHTAINSELILAEKNSQDPPIAPFFMEHIKSRLKELFSTQPEYGKINLDPYTDGLKIYTTIDSRVQIHANNALKSHLNTLQKEFDNEWTSWRWKNNKEILIKLLKLKRYTGYRKVCAYLNNETLFTPEIDSLLKHMKEDLTQLRSGFVCIKNTGEVLAWVGGSDFSNSQYDHVKCTRQVGSAFKPIVYVTAVDQGVNICNYYKNARKAYSQFDDWNPRNANNSYQGEYTMKGALTYSVNVISVQVILRAGILDVLNVARQMGITTNIPNAPSISLGTPDISLYEMVNAYTCFPNGGKRVDTKYLKNIRLSTGEIIYEDNVNESVELFTEEVAAIITNMLESVVNIGTSQAIRSRYGLKGPIAGKTGTSQNQSDGWFIAYTPQFTAGAWVGADNPDIHFRSISEGSGSKTALPIWAKFALSLEKDTNCSYLMKGEFTPPSENSLRCLNLPLYRE